MPLAELVEASEAVGATRSRLEKVERLAEVLRRLAPDEVAAGVAFLSGELRQRQIGVGWAALRDLPRAGGRSRPSPSARSTPRSSGSARSPGPGSQAARRAALGGAVRARDRAPRRGSCGGCSAASCARARSRA